MADQDSLIELKQQCPTHPSIYRDFLNKWRSSLSGGEDKIGDVHVLPMAPQDVKDTEYAFIKFKCEYEKQRHICIAKFIRHNLYLVGFRNKTKDWFSLGEDSSHGTTPLNIGVSHANLMTASGEKSLDDVKMDRKQLKLAVKCLSDLSPTDDFQRYRQKIGASCLQLVFLFAEAARSNSIRDDAICVWKIGELHKTKENTFADKTQLAWNETLIHGWDKMSRIVLNNNRLPIGELNQKLQKLDVWNPNGQLTIVDQLNEELGVIKQKRREDPKGKGRIEQQKDRKGKGPAGESSGTKGKLKGKQGKWFP